MKTLRHFDYVKAWLAYTLGATILGAFGGGFIGIIFEDHSWGGVPRSWLHRSRNELATDAGPLSYCDKQTGLQYGGLDG